MLKVGDNYFARDGRPGVVVDRDPKSGKLVVENQGEQFDKSRSYGYINGLSQTERQEFRKIIDQAREKEDPEERISTLQRQIEELQVDPKKQALTRYLEGELSHLMYTEAVFPRTYKVDEQDT